MYENKNESQSHKHFTQIPTKISHRSSRINYGTYLNYIIR